MKRSITISLLAFAFVASLFTTSCKKKQNQVSMEVTVSFPILTLLNGQYFSIRVGGILPSANVIAKAYDTFYKQNCPVVVDFTGVTNFTPGIYTAQVSAKNQYGFTSYATIYIGVTNINDTLNLSGLYLNTYNGAISQKYTYVRKVANGMFTTDNVLGVDRLATPQYIDSTFFLVIDPATIVFPSNAPNLVAYTATLAMPPLDTNMLYYVNYTGTPDTVLYVKQPM